MTVPDTTTDVTTQALAGNWQAVLADSYGEVMTWDDFSSNGLDPDEVRIHIVRGTAAPDEDGQLPGSYQPADRLVEFEYMEDMEEVEARWVQAQAMAAGLNQAAKEQQR